MDLRAFELDQFGPTCTDLWTDLLNALRLTRPLKPHTTAELVFGPKRESTVNVSSRLPRIQLDRVACIIITTA